MQVEDQDACCLFSACSFIVAMLTYPLCHMIGGQGIDAPLVRCHSQLLNLSSKASRVNSGRCPLGHLIGYSTYNTRDGSAGAGTVVVLTEANRAVFNGRVPTKRTNSTGCSSAYVKPQCKRRDRTFEHCLHISLIRSFKLQPRSVCSRNRTRVSVHLAPSALTETASVCWQEGRPLVHDK